MNLVLDLAELAPDTATSVGGAKIGRLVEMGAAGTVVPGGFVLGVEAYRAHFRASGLDERIGGIVGPLSGRSSDDELTAASEEIVAAIRQVALTAELCDAIAERYAALCERGRDVALPVAVRSSATGEDGAQSSFAGIFETYLGISGAAEVIDAVRDCWASLFGPRALCYRLERGISHHDMPMAVGVLELVPAKASGVAFSVHPVSGKGDRIVVEGSWGWGEAVVQGLVTPDRAEVGKSDLRPLRYTVATKKVISDYDPSRRRVAEREMPAELQDARVLDDEELRAIADTVRRIEQHYGHAVDVEWVLSSDRTPGGPVHVVQSRPVTVGGTAAAPSSWDPASFALRYAFQGSR
ncbi:MULTISPECIES: PEP/pyruvate-binding domain-containing protein [unclassified Nocardioides]|uniref:PEP/pyruvate-binding domain-containing protein n=1 Tax=unclassified Nocardioides TaxID=2615069 RepID=UPI0009F0DCD2|nr:MULTISPECIES: PEP/pyruvate-binding domain-containing protein [unclassified Nocardioides]GAW47705.1 Pyruvate, water dikinase [Nocardioides sp. PD653-B2]GAW56865.1 Pyruvate, water dikinase [Nocardioides sp. PD653]